VYFLHYTLLLPPSMYIGSAHLFYHQACLLALHTCSTTKRVFWHCTPVPPPSVSFGSAHFCSTTKRVFWQCTLVLPPSVSFSSAHLFYHQACLLAVHTCSTTKRVFWQCTPVLQPSVSFGSAHLFHHQAYIYSYCTQACLSLRVHE